VIRQTDKQKKRGKKEIKKERKKEKWSGGPDPGLEQSIRSSNIRL
jgi:hypothetical protein